MRRREEEGEVFNERKKEMAFGKLAHIHTLSLTSPTHREKERDPHQPTTPNPYCHFHAWTRKNERKFRKKNGKMGMWEWNGSYSCLVI